MKSRAHSTPNAKNNGAANGGPRIRAVWLVAWVIPAARARSASPFIRSAMIVKRAGAKNLAAACSTSTVP